MSHCKDVAHAGPHAGGHVMVECLPSAMRRMRGVLGALALSMVLAGCLEQESGAQGGGERAQARSASNITTQSISRAVAADAAASQAGSPAANAAEARRMDAFLNELKREARLRKQEALQMRAQIATYREALREAREQAAKYRLEIARIQEEIRKEREEMEKYKAEINILRDEMAAQAATIRKDRDQLRRLAAEADKARREMALIRQGVLQMRDDLLPKRVLSGAGASLQENGGDKAGDGALPRARPAALDGTDGKAENGKTTVKVRLPGDAAATRGEKADEPASRAQ